MSLSFKHIKIYLSTVTLICWTLSLLAWICGIQSNTFHESFTGGLSARRV